MNDADLLRVLGAVERGEGYPVETRILLIAIDAGYVDRIDVYHKRGFELTDAGRTRLAELRGDL